MELLKPLTLKQQVSQESRSLALKSILDQMGEERANGVLDLGPAVGVNVEFFSERSTNFYVADLLRTLEKQPLDWGNDELDWNPIFAELLPYDEDTRFDLILAWDVLNYLKRRQIESLTWRIRQFCKMGTLLFALISTRREIPVRARNYQILGDDRLLYKTATQALRPSPLYHEPDLRRLLAGFEVKSSFLLRNGTQEYLLTYNPHLGF